MISCFPNPQAIPQPVTWAGAVVVVPPGDGLTMDRGDITVDDETITTDETTH